MFFQEVPPDTLNYMILGFSVIFGGMALNLISMFVRKRNLEQDLETLRDLEEN